MKNLKENFEIKSLIPFAIILILGFFLIPNFSSAHQTICAIYFTGVGCPHCAKTDSVILEDLLRDYPNLLIIEYEIYQQRQNAYLLYEYDTQYHSGLGIPLIIFSKNQYTVGDFPILKNVRKIIEGSQFNKCPLIDGSSIDFPDLDLNLLPGFPKIWRGEKILIKTGSQGDNKLLKELLRSNNLSETLKDVDFEEIEPLKIPLSGKNIEFDNALKINDWIFQWNGESLEMPIIFSEDGGPADGQTPVEIKPELTLAKVLSLATVDAINPCALAVLSLMLIAILTYNPTKKRNILLAGLAFVISVFLMYLIYGLVIIKSFQLIQALTSIRLWLYKILGFGAIILGCFNLRRFFWSKAVCKVSPRVDRVISKITSPKGAFLVGAFVTIFLLPCTIGPYIICGGVLCPLGILKSLPWLLLYNLIFILPMLAVVLIIYFGFSKVEDVSKWQAKNMKYLDLVAGLVILGLGIAMVLGLV